MIEVLIWLVRRGLSTPSELLGKYICIFVCIYIFISVFVCQLVCHIQCDDCQYAWECMYVYRCKHPVKEFLWAAIVAVASWTLVASLNTMPNIPFLLFIFVFFFYLLLFFFCVCFLFLFPFFCFARCIVIMSLASLYTSQLYSTL